MEKLNKEKKEKMIFLIDGEQISKNIIMRQSVYCLHRMIIKHTQRNIAVQFEIPQKEKPIKMSLLDLLIDGQKYITVIDKEEFEIRKHIALKTVRAKS